MIRLTRPPDCIGLLVGPLHLSLRTGVQTRAVYTGTPEPAPACPHVPVGEPRCNACYAGEIISA